MKTIIAGSRHIHDPDLVEIAISLSGISISEVASGDASGVDRLGKDWAIANGIPVKYFPANRATHGEAAGQKCSREMARYADALIAIWDGESRDTKNMVEEARKNKLRIFSYIVASSFMSNAGHKFLIETDYNTTMEASSEEELLRWAEKRFSNDQLSLRELKTFLKDPAPEFVRLIGYTVKR